MVYKFIFSLLLLFTFACKKIDRDNILDPKNPSSKRDKVLLLEAFLNTNRSADPYNEYALDAITNLSMDKDIRDHLIILEYHRDTQDFIDSLEADSLNTEAIYKNYLSFDPDRFKGVPDLFINGAENRVQGASSADNVINRVKNIAIDQLMEDGEYTLETDFDLNGTTIEGQYRVARLGDTATDDMFLRMVVTYNAGNNGNETVSRVVNPPIPISPIDAGEYFEGDFSITGVPAGKAQKLVLVLTDQSKLVVLYALEKEIL